MLPLPLLLSSALLDQTAPLTTIEDVKVTSRFAGQLGRRLVTHLTLSQGGEAFTVILKDTRHSRFQKENLPLAAGTKVRITGGPLQRRTSLRLEEIRPL